MSKTYKNKNLHKALLDFSQIAFGIVLQKITITTDLPKTTRVIVRRGPDASQTNLSEVPEIDWSRLYYSFRNEIINTGECKKFTDILLKSKKISSQLNTLVGTSEGAMRVEAHNIWEGILFSLLKHSDKTFSRSKFEKLYKDLETYFYSDYFVYRYLAPIKNFKSDRDKIQLEKNLHIAKLSDKEFEDLHSFTAMFSFGNENFFNRSDYAFIYEGRVKKVVGSNQPLIPGVKTNHQVVTELFDDLSSTLRLLKPGNINYNTIYPIPVSWTPAIGRSTSSFNDRPTVLGSPYHLLKKEKSKLLKLWSSYKKYTKIKTSSIDVAIRRFSLGYNRMRPDDKLIDYLIGFEALLLPNDKLELSFKLALRTAVLIGKNIKQKKEIFSIMKKAYGVRSSIVHGEEIKFPVVINGKNFGLSDLVNSTESYLRLGIINIIKILKSKKKHQEVINFLEDKAVSGAINKTK